MTESTNQLTRKTSLLASTKCQQLAKALQSMANRMAYEDVQIAATQISECATNVLSVRRAEILLFEDFNVVVFLGCEWSITRTWKST